MEEEERNQKETELKKKMNALLVDIITQLSTAAIYVRNSKLARAQEMSTQLSLRASALRRFTQAIIVSPESVDIVGKIDPVRNTKDTYLRHSGMKMRQLFQMLCRTTLFTPDPELIHALSEEITNVDKMMQTDYSVEPTPL